MEAGGRARKRTTAIRAVVESRSELARPLRGVGRAAVMSEAIRTPTSLLGPNIRRTILEQSKRAHVGHIGSALSIADMVGAVFRVADIPDPDDPDRDRIVLSKGHAALALYAALAGAGVLSEADLETFCGDSS